MLRPYFVFDFLSSFHVDSRRLTTARSQSRRAGHSVFRGVSLAAWLRQAVRLPGGRLARLRSFPADAFVISSVATDFGRAGCLAAFRADAGACRIAAFSGSRR